MQTSSDTGLYTVTGIAVGTDVGVIRYVPADTGRTHGIRAWVAVIQHTDRAIGLCRIRAYSGAGVTDSRIVALIECWADYICWIRTDSPTQALYTVTGIAVGTTLVSSGTFPQTPAVHTGSVHGLPSSNTQTVPSVFSGFEHKPVVVSQTPASWH